MPLFLIAAMGLILFFFFLKSLTRSEPSFLGLVIQGTSFTLLAVSFFLFILSSRIFPATILALIVGIMIFHRFKGRKVSQPLLFLTKDSSDKDIQEKK